MTLQFEVNGDQVQVDDDGATLLEVLRDVLGLTSVKDGCSPQGQCGCCTVLVDGEPRVSCVTPVRRVSERSVQTLEGLDAPVADAWGEVLCATGASQCGFCTPGIVMRLEGLRSRGDLTDHSAVNRALAAHLCRCTGWQTIVEAAAALPGRLDDPSRSFGTDSAPRDLEAASRRATIEGGRRQRVAPDVALGHGGFADDTAPAGTKVGVPNPEDGWTIGSSMSEARARAGKVQGRRSTVDPHPPLEVPPGDWAVTLQTSWVDPGYLETDASWCVPEGIPADPLANAGAFGAKESSTVADDAAALAQTEGTPVRLRWSREHALRNGPKRPPVAIGIRADGSGVMRVVATPGIATAVASIAPDIVVEEVTIEGPPTSAALRGAGWVEAAVARAVLATSGDDPGPIEVTSPAGAWASVRIDDAGAHVRVRCGEVLDDVVLRSYCIGAVHMALGWVTSEGLTVDDHGAVLSLTLRSLGIVRPGAMIPVHVEIEPDAGRPVSGSDAVFAASAAAIWRHQGLPPSWPTGRALSTMTP